MNKIEYIWRELLYRSIEEKNADFRLSELAEKFGLSTSMVSHALYPLRKAGMVQVGKNNSKVVDAYRLLFFWATRRDVVGDIVYKTYNPMTVFAIEASMPSDVLPTAYSAVRFYSSQMPADYETVYFYSLNPQEIMARFPLNIKKEANIYILKQDPFLRVYKKTPPAQIFADLWNLPQWYGNEYREAVISRIKGQLGL